jgi:hypothetical protein
MVPTLPRHGAKVDGQLSYVRRERRDSIDLCRRIGKGDLLAARVPGSRSPKSREIARGRRDEATTA